MIDLADRHPSTQHIARFFEYEHLPPHLQAPSKACHDLAVTMIRALDDSAELTAGLRKLVEAKDCFVRAALPPGPRRPLVEAQFEAIQAEREALAADAGMPGTTPQG